MEALGGKLVTDLKRRRLTEEEKRIFTETQEVIQSGDVESLTELLSRDSESFVDEMQAEIDNVRANDIKIKNNKTFNRPI